ncbi:MAG TPA: aminoacyl-tRNA hydrolase [Thermoplasmata archaeon]|nr:aminoacyl-tRNA hydrolase [Thermoplasmata archaeon]
MVLVLRADLRLTPGKAAVQAAHAAVNLVTGTGGGKAGELLKAWMAEGARKIAVTAPTLDAMRELERAARARGLPTTMIQDAGYTEVAPGTVTCLGIGPGRNGDVDAVTGELALL